MKIEVFNLVTGEKGTEITIDVLELALEAQGCAVCKVDIWHTTFTTKR